MPSPSDVRDRRILPTRPHLALLVGHRPAVSGLRRPSRTPILGRELLSHRKSQPLRKALSRCDYLLFGTTPNRIFVSD
uniref:Uncharacterized protein n=1 Tax=Leersia perrieri TaxID=77586 RepID=A0A0D9XZM9_9ORYZ